MAYKQKGHALPGINQRLDSKSDPRGNSSAFQQRSLVSVSDSLSTDAQSKHDSLQAQLSKDYQINNSAAQMMVNTGSDYDETSAKLLDDNRNLQDTAQASSDSTWTANKAQFGPLASEMQKKSSGEDWNKMVTDFNASEEQKKGQ